MRKVFSQDLYTQLEAAVQIEKAANNPAVVYFKNVLIEANVYAGVKAYNANILFAFNDDASDAFLNENPVVKTKMENIPSTELLDKYFMRKDIDSSFPYIPVYHLSFTEDLSVAIAKNTCNNLKRSPNLAEFIKLVKDTGASS